MGFVSLYLMQSLVTQRYGRAGGWVFVAGVAGLSSFGIIAQPGKLYHGISAVATGQGHPHQFAFLALFATFIFITYLMLYALTHLPTALQLHPPQTPEALARA